VGGLVKRIKNESVCKILKLYDRQQIKNELFFITPAERGISQKCR